MKAVTIEFREPEGMGAAALERRSHLVFLLRALNNAKLLGSVTVRADDGSLILFDQFADDGEHRGHDTSLGFVPAAPVHFMDVGAGVQPYLVESCDVHMDGSAVVRVVPREPIRQWWGLAKCGCIAGWSFIPPLQIKDRQVLAPAVVEWVYGVPAPGTDGMLSYHPVKTGASGLLPTVEGAISTWKAPDYLDRETCTRPGPIVWVGEIQRWVEPPVVDGPADAV